MTKTPMKVNRMQSTTATTAGRANLETTLTPAMTTRASRKSRHVPYSRKQWKLLSKMRACGTRYS